MKKLSTVFLLIAIVALSGCGSDGVGGGNGGDSAKAIQKGENYIEMDADLTDAVKITATLPEKGRVEKRKLLKVTRDGKFEQVFNGDYQLFHYKLTPTHIIADVNIWENGKHCSLIAIPKIQGKTQVLCLNRELVSCGADDVAYTYFNFDIRGTEVFFAFHEMVKKQNYAGSMYCHTNSATGEWYASNSELRSWDGKSNKVITHFRTEPGPVMGKQLLVRQVFASQTNKNICIYTDNGGPFFCKNEEGSSWNKMSISGNFFKQKNLVLASNSGVTGFGSAKLDLETLKISERQGPVPYIYDFALENGGYLGRDYVDLIKILPDSNSEKVLEIEKDIPASQVGNWGWYIAGDSLRRVNLKDGSLDAKDYFSETTLIRMSALYWSLGDFLRIDGTGSNGMPAKTYLDIQGALAHVSYPPINVEHPIDLKWEN